MEKYNSQTTTSTIVSMANDALQSLDDYSTDPIYDVLRHYDFYDTNERTADGSLMLEHRSRAGVLHLSNDWTSLTQVVD